MASFGENLRREREMRGVTLEEISAATKVSVRFLHALEAEDFSKLPSGIFTRGFIRAYAKYLGLDEERVLAEYQLIAQPTSDVDLSRLAFAKPRPHREGPRTPFFAFFLAVALLAGGYALFRYSRRAPEVTSPVSPPAATPAGSTAVARRDRPQEVSTPTPAPAAGSAVAETRPAPSQKRESPSPGIAEFPPGQAGLDLAPGASEMAGGLMLQVAATERAWVAIDVDGKTALQRVLEPNEIQTLKAKESFDVTTGNAHGIILTLNGETLKPLGRRGEVKTVHLTRDDLKKISP